jgi:hypothetical protein
LLDSPPIEKPGSRESGLPEYTVAIPAIKVARSIPMPYTVSGESLNYVESMPLSD